MICIEPTLVFHVCIPITLTYQVNMVTLTPSAVNLSAVIFCSFWPDLNSLKKITTTLHLYALRNMQYRCWHCTINIRVTLITLFINFLLQSIHAFQRKESLAPWIPIFYNNRSVEETLYQTILSMRDEIDSLVLYSFLKYLSKFSN